MWADCIRHCTLKKIDGADCIRNPIWKYYYVGRLHPTLHVLKGADCIQNPKMFRWADCIRRCTFENSFERGGLYPKPDFWKMVGRTELRRCFEREFEKGNGLYPKPGFER